MRGRGRTEGRVRCKWEAGAEGWLELIQSRGGGSPLAVRGKEGEKQREITTPLLVIEIIRCQHSTSFTMPTFSPPPLRDPSYLRFVFPLLDNYIKFSVAKNTCRCIKTSNQIWKLEV